MLLHVDCALTEPLWGFSGYYIREIKQLFYASLYSLSLSASKCHMIEGFKVLVFDVTVAFLYGNVLFLCCVLVLGCFLALP